MNGGPALPNVGPGPDSLSISALEADFAVLLLHRDFYCSECRQQVRRVKRRYDEFETRDAEVLSVLPEARETAEAWQKQYHLPFPVLADAEKQWGEWFDQPRKYGLLGRIHDIIGRMPAAIVLDLRWSDPMETFAQRGDSKTDRPRVDELLAAIDEAATVGADSTPEDREAAADAVAMGATGLPPETKGGREPTGAPETGETAEAEGPAETDGAAAATETGEPQEPSDAGAASEAGETADTAPATEETAGTENAGPLQTDEGDAEDGAEPAETADDGANSDTASEAKDGGDAADDGEESGDDETAAADEPPEPVTVPAAVDLPGDVELRRAVTEDAMPVIRVLHGALLEIDGSTVRQAVDRGDVIVADVGGWVVGALVLEDNHIDALAVRREHRKQGLGRALVETAGAEIGGPMTADFRAGVRGFWTDLDFEIEQEGARFYGIRR